MKQKYAVKSRKFGLALPPWLTLLLLIATIVMMVVGLFTFENVILSIIAWAVAIVAVLGLFSDRFINAFNNWYENILERYKKRRRSLCEASMALYGLGSRFHRWFVLDDASHTHHPRANRRYGYNHGYGVDASRHISRPHGQSAPRRRKDGYGFSIGEKHDGHLRFLHDGWSRILLWFFLH